MLIFLIKWPLFNFKGTGVYIFGKYLATFFNYYLKMNICCNFLSIRQVNGKNFDKEQVSYCHRARFSKYLMTNTKYRLYKQDLPNCRQCSHLKEILRISSKLRIKKVGMGVISFKCSLQWCAYQNHNDPIYEVNDLFLTWCFTI